MTRPGTGSGTSRPKARADGHGTAAGLPDAEEDLLGALRCILLADSSPPALSGAAVVAAARRVQRTLSRVLADDALWSSLGDATAPPEATRVTADLVSRAEDLATDHLTRAVLLSGHTPPPPASEVVDAVVRRIRRRRPPQDWRSEQPEAVALATRAALQDLHDELQDAVQEAEDGVGSPDGPAATSDVAPRAGDDRAAAPDREPARTERLRAALSAAKKPILCLAAGIALCTPSVATAGSAEALSDLSINLAGSALIAAAGTSWSRRRDASAPDDLSRRLEEARVRREEELTRQATGQADEATARARRATAEAELAERRARRKSDRKR